jgi:two-component sensor histidine kinase
MRRTLSLAVLPIIFMGTGLASVFLHYERREAERDVTAQVTKLQIAVGKELEKQVAALHMLADTMEPYIDKEEFREVAERLKVRHPYWRILRLFEPDGDRIVDHPEYARPPQLHGQESFDKAVETRQVQIGKLEQGPNASWAFPIRVPVIREEGVRYVLSAAVEPWLINRIIEQSTLPEHWVGNVIDSSGLLIARRPATMPDDRIPSAGALEARRSITGTGTYEGASLERTPIVGGIAWVQPWGWSVHVGSPRNRWISKLADSATKISVLSAVGFVIFNIFLWDQYRAMMAARRAAANRQALLTREVFHRTRNLLTITQAIARRTFRGERPWRDEVDAFMGRLHALARTDKAMLDANYEPIRAADLVRDALEFTGRYKIVDGKDVWTKGSMTQDFAMLVHELATNSLKYGALSEEQGWVIITLRMQENDCIFFRWEETGGPPVKEPTRRGFGLDMISRVARGMHASADCQFPETGVVCEMTLPKVG